MGDKAANERYRERHRERINARHRRWSEENRDTIWARGLLARHGLRPEQWWQMWIEQDGRCYLCMEPMDSDRINAVHVDHDPSHCPSARSCVVCRRGLAHSKCNRWIGQMDDDPDRMRRMADALEAAKRNVAARIAAVTESQAELPIDIRRAARRREESA